MSFFEPIYQQGLMSLVPGFDRGIAFGLYAHVPMEFGCAMQDITLLQWQATGPLSVSPCLMTVSFG